MDGVLQEFSAVRSCLRALEEVHLSVEKSKLLSPHVTSPSATRCAADPEDHGNGLLERQLKEAQATIKDLEGEVQALHRKLEGEQEISSRLNEQAVELLAQLESSQKKLHLINEVRVKDRMQVNQSQETASRLRAEVVHWKDDMLAWEQLTATVGNEFEGLKGENQRLQSLLNRSDEALHEVRTLNAQLESQREDALRQLKEQREEFQLCQAELATSRHQVEVYEESYASVQQLSENAQHVLLNLTSTQSQTEAALADALSLSEEAALGLKIEIPQVDVTGMGHLVHHGGEEQGEKKDVSFMENIYQSMGDLQSRLSEASSDANLQKAREEAGKILLEQIEKYPLDELSNSLQLKQELTKLRPVSVNWNNLSDSVQNISKTFSHTIQSQSEEIRRLVSNLEKQSTYVQELEGHVEFYRHQTDEELRQRKVGTLEEAAAVPKKRRRVLAPKETAAIDFGGVIAKEAAMCGECLGPVQKANAVQCAVCQATIHVECLSHKTSTHCPSCEQGK